MSKAVIATKRSPVCHEEKANGTISLERPRWAIMNVLCEMASNLGATWVASAGNAIERELARQLPEGWRSEEAGEEPLDIRLIAHEPELFRQVDDQLSSDLLWSILNYCEEEWCSIEANNFTRQLWQSFSTFSESYASACCRDKHSANSLSIFLHDYQMVLVPGYIRNYCTNASILLCLHTPWPEADFFRIMPKYMRLSMLQSMLTADAIVFLSKRWGNNFLKCISENIPDTFVDNERGEVVMGNGHAAYVGRIPLGYSERVLRTPVADLGGEYTSWIADRPLVVHYGRSDPRKNALTAIKAFGLALDQSPGISHARLLCRVNPHRLHVPANRKYFEEIFHLRDVVNGKAGDEVVRVEVGDDIPTAYALYRRADAVLVNSLIDGQNLTAFEASMLSDRDSSLILSEHCGAAEVLGSTSILVNPRDIVGQSKALQEAITAKSSWRRLKANNRRREVEKYSSTRWIQDQVQMLQVIA